MFLYLLFYCLLLVTTIVLGKNCNGHLSLCDRAYSNVTFLATHDSYAVGSSIAATQDESIAMQLNAGVRGIKLSAVLSPKQPHTIRLCHTDCRILDAGPASATLDTIATWLQQNPDEVVTIMWNNLHDIDATLFAEAYKGAIMPYVYTHKMGSAWPTLQDMISSGQRLVNFVDAQANTTAVPWLLDQFSEVFETPYKNVDAKDFNCKVDRPSSLASTQGMMYVLNHFLYGQIRLADYEIDIPMRDKAHFINAQSLREHLKNCTQIFGRSPSFVEVDFYESGGKALELVALANGIVSPDQIEASMNEIKENDAKTEGKKHSFELKTLVVGNKFTIFSSGVLLPVKRLSKNLLLFCISTIVALTG